MSEFLKYLLECKDVLYIYNQGSIIYGINDELSDIDYLVVVQEYWTLPEKYKDYVYTKDKQFNNIKIGDEDFIFFGINEWFKKVMNGNMEAWECACLNKKFILKEHVKLMLVTNPLQLRKHYEAQPLYYEHLNTRRRNKFFWNRIKYVKFANQIIENHKIINMKQANDDWNQLKNIEDKSEAYDKYQSLIEKDLLLFYKYTDGILKRDREKTILERINANL